MSVEFREVKDEVYVSLDEIVELDLDGFNDLICELTQEPYLQDITFSPISVRQDGSILIKVRGYVDPEDENDYDWL